MARVGFLGIIAVVAVLAACEPVAPRPSPLLPTPNGSKPKVTVPTTQPPTTLPPTTLPPSPGASCAANVNPSGVSDSERQADGAGPTPDAPGGSTSGHRDSLTVSEAYEASLELADEEGSVTVAATTPDGDFELRTIDAEDSPGLIVMLALSGHEIAAVSTPGTVHATGDPSNTTVEQSTSGLLSASVSASSAPAGAGLGDPFRSYQWSLGGTDFDQLWDRTDSGAGVTVAVIDTGVDATNPDLTNRVAAGVDFISEPNGPETNGKIDPNGHGTHVAGIVAAEQDNGVGVAGVAPSATIMPIRVLDESGSGSSHDVAHGITWAVDHGADVINLSLSGGHDPVMRAAITDALDEGVVVIAAAGNTSSWINNTNLCDVDSYPAAYGDVIAVGSLNSNNKVSSFSLKRDYVDIAAPGESILSTWPTALTPWGYEPYYNESGTSMAAPYVSGVVALMKSDHPAIDVESIRSALLASAAPAAGATTRDPGRGCGRVDPLGAVLSVDGDGNSNGIPGCGVPLDG